MRVKLTLALAFVACVLTLPSAVSADISGATITVNTTADRTGGPGCTLRDAITAANTDTVAGGCRAGHGADTIDFDVSGQINLGSTLPAVASALTIDGSDQSIVVRGQGAVRVLEVGAGASLTLHRLTVADGDAANAGGVLNRGILVVIRSTLSGNKTTGFGNGGAIWNTAGGTLTVRRSSFSGNGAPFGPGRVTLGAGIYNDGRALIRKSSFADNSAELGGGISTPAGSRSGTAPLPGTAPPRAVESTTPACSALRTAPSSGTSRPRGVVAPSPARRAARSRLRTAFSLRTAPRSAERSPPAKGRSPSHTAPSPPTSRTRVGQSPYSARSGSSTAPSGATRPATAAASRCVVPGPSDAAPSP